MDYNMEYYIGKFDGELKKYLFMFSDNNWIYIDLYNEYPDYITPKNNVGNEWWHFTLKEKSESSTKKLSIGDIIEINYLDLRREKSTLIKEYHINGLHFRPSSQTDLDKYYDKISPNSDNARLYRHLESLYYKYKESLKTKKQTTLVTEV